MRSADAQDVIDGEDDNTNLHKGSSITWYILALQSTYVGILFLLQLTTRLHVAEPSSYTKKAGPLLLLNATLHCSRGTNSIWKNLSGVQAPVSLFDVRFILQSPRFDMYN